MIIIFSDDFETGDFSKWTYSELVIISTEKGYSATHWEYMEKLNLSIPSDFEWNFDFRIRPVGDISYEADVGIYNQGINNATYEMDIVNNTGYFYWRDASLVLHSSTIPVNLSGNVDVNGWVNTGIAKVGDIIYVKINGNTVSQINLTNPYNNGLNAFFVYGYSDNDAYDNFVLSSPSPEAEAAISVGRPLHHSTGASVSSIITCGRHKEKLHKY